MTFSDSDSVINQARVQARAKQLDKKILSKRLPDVILIGGKKCGTQTLGKNHTHTT